MSLVLDSSVTLTWCFEDERRPDTLDILTQVTEEGAIAPALWPLEILNALLMAERRQRLDSAQRQQLGGFLHDLPVMLDHQTAAQSWNVTSHLAQRYKLTLYDAAYLELAQRRNLPLATLNEDLREAALALGVPLLGKP